ncbi:MAG: ribonuclease P protein component 1 [Haloarculaceae archaeon]
MALTPETLPRHELVGLDVRVTEAANADLLDVEGEVVMETTETLTIEGADRVWQVPKEGTTFTFDVPDGESVTRVSVEGSRLVARPARRTENTGDSTWR